MPNSKAPSPDSTAERTALWRALHLQADAPPHVFEDDIGLRLLAPPDSWRERPDMDPIFTRTFRASMVARARFVEDLVLEQAAQGVAQYVILGAGLDSFAQRRPDIASRMRVFEVDQPAPQEWKRRRLVELGYGVPEWLQLVPVDFEAGASAWQALAEAGFDATRPAFVASTGVSMYLTRDATLATFRQVAALAPGSTLAMTFVLPVEQMAPEVRPGIEMAVKGARARDAVHQLLCAGPDHGDGAGGGVPRCPARRARRARAAVLRGANGRLELVERRRISDCGHVAGEYCPTADPALIPGHQTARHPTRQAPRSLGGRHLNRDLPRTPLLRLSSRACAAGTSASA